MKLIKTASSAAFAVFALCAASSALELNAVRLADIQELSADMLIPLPQPPTTLGPVIITVPGLRFGEIGWGSLEIRSILRFVQIFYPGANVSEDNVDNGLVAFNPSRYLPDAEKDADGFAAPILTRMPDNYLELKLKQLPGYESSNAVIIPFAWSRDPGDTKRTLPKLQAKIIEVYDTYSASGRPVYVLAHSWGSVLSHTALHRVGRVRPDVRIEKFITAGSPLVPANIVARLFVKFQALKGRLEKRVTKPAVVGTWRNFWAARDAYSNAIPAADSNFQADANVENLEPVLIRLILHNSMLKKEASRDLFKIRDIKAWHGSYFFDYQASLKSINKEILISVFRPSFAPHVVPCAENPVPVCAP